MFLKSFCITLGCLVMSASWAHHSDGIYDRSQLVAFSAKVVGFEFRNPHVTTFVEEEEGDRRQWEIETGSTPIMRRSGWSEDTFAIGDIVQVRAHPSRTGELKAILNSIQSADGNTWIQVEQAPEVTAAAESLEGVWRGEPATELSLDNGTVLFTSAGIAAERVYEETSHSQNSRCEPLPPPFLNSNALYLTEIEFTEEAIFMRNEFFDVERTVYMDGRSHPTDGTRSAQGHSIGWWEEDVLVVDTRLLADHQIGGAFFGIPSTSGKHVIERYSLSQDRKRALVDIWFEDPEYLTEPFVGQTTLVYSPELELYSYECIPQ
jgi:hypothetical protein